MPETNPSLEDPSAAVEAQSIKAVPAAVPVLELRATDSYKLLAKLYPDEGWLEIKHGATWYRVDVRALLAHKPPDKMLPMSAIRP